MGSKVRSWQLMRQSTPLALCGRYGERKGYEGVTVVRWCCHTHTGNEVSSCVGRVLERLPVCILALWIQCGLSGIVCGLPVDSRWPVNTWLRAGVLEAQDGGAVGVAWPFPSGSPLRALIEHFRL